MTFEKFLAILRDRWQTLAITILAVVALATALSLIIPPRYKGTASVVLDLRLPDPIIGSVLNSISGSAYMATQIDVMGSERVARKVIEKLALDKNEDWKQDWLKDTDGEGDFHAWLSEQLLKKLVIKPARESNSFSIIYTAKTPQLAADMANAFLQAYIDTTLELRVDPARQYNAMFDERTKALRDSLEVAQSRLSTYQREKGLLASDERFDIETTRMADLSAQLVAVQAAAAESMGRSSKSGMTPGQMKEVLSDPVVADLKTDLAKDTGRLSELQERLGDNHPQVIQQRARVRDLERRIATSIADATGSLRVNASVGADRVRQTTEDLTEQRQKVLRMKSYRDEAAVLQRDVENAQRSYDAMQARLNQSSTESFNTQTNVGILQKATVPAAAAFPKLPINIVLAIVLGIIIGTILVMLKEGRDRRLRVITDILLELNQNLLIVLPGKSDGKRSVGLQKPMHVKARLLPNLARST